MDSNNNIFIGGHFRENISFDNNSNNFDFTSGQFGDAFLQKFDENGQFLWAKVFLSDASNETLLIALDNEDNIYLTGSFNGSIDLDPGPGEDIHSSTIGNKNAYIVKLDNNGDYIWGKSFQDTSPNQSITPADLVVDNLGNLVLTGHFQTTMDFDFSNNDFNMTASITDGFILKIDNDGNFIWAKQISGNLHQFYFYCTAIDSQNNIISGGNFSDQNYETSFTDFDPGPNVFNLKSEYGYDLFILKLDENGDFVWAKKAKESESLVGRDVVSTVTTDDNDNILFAGGFRNRIDFEPNSNAYTLDSGINGCDNCVGYQTGYLAKMDQYGNMLWAKKIEGDNYASSGFSITPHTEIVLKFNNNQELYLGYTFRGTLDYSINGDNFSNPGDINSWRISFLKINPVNGDFISTHFLNDPTRIGRIRYKGDKLYATGRFSGSLSFDSETSITSAPYSDVNNTCCTMDAFTVEYIPQNLDLADNFKSEKFNFYPTITESLIHLHTRELENDFTIKIYDSMGKDLSLKIESNSIDLSSLSKGIYFINYSSNSANITKKLIKK